MTRGMDRSPGDLLVNDGKFSFIHIKSGEVRAGYEDIKEMAQDVVEMYKAFKHIDPKNYPNELYEVVDEFSIIVPLKLVDEVMAEIETLLMVGK